MTSCSSIAGQLTSIQNSISGLSGTFATKAEVSELEAKIDALELIILNLDNNYLKKEEKPQIIQQSVATAEQLILPGVVVLIAKAVELLRPEIKAVEVIAKGASAIASKLAVLIPFITALIALASSVGVLLVLGSRIDALEGGISALSNDLSKAFGQIGLVQRTATTAKTLAESAKKDIEDLASVVAILATTIYREVDAKIASFRAKIEGDIAKIVARINEIQVLVNDIQIFVREILREFLLEVVSNLRFLIQEANNEIAKVREVANIGLETARTAFARVRSLEEEIPDIRARIGSVEAAIATVRSGIADIRASITGLLGRIGSLEVVIPDIREKSQTAVDIATGVQREIPAIRASIPPLVQSSVPPIVQNIVPPLIQNLTPPIVRDTVQPLINNFTNQVTTIINNTINNMNVDLTPVLTAVARVDTKVNNIFQFVGRIDNTTQETKKDVKTVDDKMGKKIPNGGLSGWMLRFSKWAVVEKIINLLTLATTIHNAQQLSSNIFVTLIQAMQNVIDFIGITDSEGKAYDLQSIIGNSIENAVKTIIGEENYLNFQKEWAKYNRTYQAAGNLFSSLMNMGDTITQGLQVVGGQTGKIGNALRAWGVVSDKAYSWFNPNPNFSNPLLTKLNSLEETASMVENVSQQPLNVKSVKEELENASKELADSLAQEEGSKQGKEIPEARRVRQEQDEIIILSKGKDLAPSDLEPDED